MVITLLYFILTISVLVTVHEFGHYWVARRCGVRVLRFSIGFGPIIFSRTLSSGMRFIISAIPLGGYVQMLDGRTEELSPQDKRYAYDSKSIAKRAAIISAGSIANFVLAFFVYWIIFQAGVTSYPVQVASILPNSPASTANIPMGAELKTIAGIKVSDWRDVQLGLISQIGKDNIEIEFSPKNEHLIEKRVVNISSWRVDLESENPISAFGFEAMRPRILPVLSSVNAGSAADRIGLKVGDEILQYNGINLNDWNAFTVAIKKGEPMTLRIKRNGSEFSVDLVPDLREVEGQSEQIGFAGIAASSDVVVTKYNPIVSVGKALEQTFVTIKITVRSFYQLITGVVSLKNLSGPLTIAKTADQSASHGAVSYLYFLAFISISLGVVNLIPLPVLDGGHLLLLTIEKFKGSPLSESKQALFYRFGIIALTIIMVIAIFNDFSRL